MPALNRISSRQAKCSDRDESNTDDPELGYRSTTSLQGLNCGGYPYRQDTDLSSGTYETNPDGARRAVQGSQYVLPATTYQVSSRRPLAPPGLTPSILLPINTTSTRVAWRRSYPDSEFSGNQVPVSPDRYEDALGSIEGDSPSNPGKPPLNEVEENKTHDRGYILEAICAPGTGEDDQQGLPYNTLIRSSSSNGSSDQAWSLAPSCEAHQMNDPAPQPLRKLNAPVHLSRSVSPPRRALDAVSLPCMPLLRSSSGSVSTDILNISPPFAANSEHALETTQLPSGPSDFLPWLTSTGSAAPFIDLEVPEGTIDSRSSSGLQSASVSRYSGFVVQNDGLQQMSEEEAEAGLQATMQSLGAISRGGQRTFSRSEEIWQDDSSVRFQEDECSIAEQQYRLLRPGVQHVTALDPGSSQTSSSTSADELGRVIASRGGRVGLYKGSSLSSPTRNPTPPLLYGKCPMSFSDVKHRENLMTSRPFVSMAEDWETVSDIKIHQRGGNDDAADTQTGSSLADNSDPGDASVIEPNISGPRKLGASQHPGLPRPHQAFVLLKDDQSDLINNVPQRDFQGTHLYRHPVPIAKEHLNPFSSSAPAVQSYPTGSIRRSGTPAQHLQRQISVKSSSTGGFDKLVESYGSINDSRSGQDVADLGKGQGAFRQEPHSKAAYPESSTWLSTVSESTSGEGVSLPLRSGSFAKVTVLNSRGNLTGTPEGTGAREVGSSLAGASSPIDIFSSSHIADLDSVRLPSVEAEPPQTPRQQKEADPLATPEVASSVASKVDTPTRLQTFAPLAEFKASSSLTFHVQTPSHQKVPSSVIAIPNASSIYSSGGRSPNEYASADSEAQSRLTSRVRALNLESPSRQQHRRSSSESNGRVITSRSTTKASALQSPKTRGHKKRNTTAGLLSSYSPFDNEVPRESQHQTRMRESQGRRADTESDRPSTSATLRSTRHNEVLYSNNPLSVCMHSVYGNMPASDSLQRSRIQVCPVGSQRVPARAESPHLHRVPHIDTAELLERREQISKLWLSIFCAIPPCALIFGFGYADEIMRMQSGGHLESFTEWSKRFAVFWALSATPVIIVVAVVCDVFASSL